MNGGAGGPRLRPLAATFRGQFPVAIDKFPIRSYIVCSEESVRKAGVSRWSSLSTSGRWRRRGDPTPVFFANECSLRRRRGDPLPICAKQPQAHFQTISVAWLAGDGGAPPREQMGDARAVSTNSAA